MFRLQKHLLTLLAFLVSSASLQAIQVERHEWSRPFMGTIFHIVVYSEEGRNPEPAVYEAFDRIEELEETFSFYQGDSELNLLAESAYAEPVIAGTDLFEILDSSLNWSRLTGGAFDCSIRPLITLWQQCGSLGKSPSAEELARARTKIGYEKILLNPRLRSVRLLAPEMRLDLGGIAKGFSADKAKEILELEGFKSILIDAGGDLSIGNPPPGEKGWLVTLDFAEGRPALRIADTSIATSGDKYKFYDINGIRYSHIVNPNTGLGMTDHRQVTVIAPNGESADALATALSVMDIQAGLDLINSLEKTEALIRVYEHSLINNRVNELESGTYPEPMKDSHTFYRTPGFPAIN